VCAIECSYAGDTVAQDTVESLPLLCAHMPGTTRDPGLRPPIHCGISGGFLGGGGGGPGILQLDVETLVGFPVSPQAVRQTALALNGLAMHLNASQVPPSLTHRASQLALAAGAIAEIPKTTTGAMIESHNGFAPTAAEPEQILIINPSSVSGIACRPAAAIVAKEGSVLLALSHNSVQLDESR
jgi:hypothetical protein